MISKVLIANRGEIAVRIARTLREMGIATVAVFSEGDRGALHVRMCDEAVELGPTEAAESYLHIERIIRAARSTGADAIHPGYGFLSENADFAEACARAGIVFIGPPASAMRQMGSKTAARELMKGAGVPIVPGGGADTLDEAFATARAIGFPLMVKAAKGGGGKGMRLVADESTLAAAWQSAKSIAAAAFGDDTVYFERALVRPRHVEIQVLGDMNGDVVHLFERDCSVQRRHQKIVEETPCPAAPAELVAEMGRIAVQGAKAVGYHSAGTFEFLLDASGEFYFLEMNTRLQVEHPITEWITGIDLVEQMVRIARGEPLGFTQRDVVRRGAAIECRVYAEDPSTGFLPSPGRILHLSTPAGPNVRDDSGVVAGSEVSSAYDPLISKLSVWGASREMAIARMQRALGEYVVDGVRTNLDFHQRLMAHPDFLRGAYDTGIVDRLRDELCSEAPGTGPAVDDDRLMALAVSAAHSDAKAGAAARTAAGPGEAAQTPWLAAHRARLR